MLQQLRRFPLVAILVLATAAAACGGDDPSDPDDDDGTSAVTFTYVPAAGGPDVTAVTVRGTFNGWGDPPSGTQLEMTEGGNGTWSAEIELEPGTYEYKYFFNGTTWSENMCADGVWGNPAGGEVSPQNEGCVGGFNNASITVDEND